MSKPSIPGSASPAKATPALVNSDGNAAPRSNPAATSDSASHSDLLLSLIDRVPDSILCLDRDFRIIFANAEARRVSHLTAADINSRSLWEIFPETVESDLERTYREVMHSGKPAHIEYFHTPTDTWVDINVLPTEEGIALYYRDITDRKRAEASRDAATHKLQLVFESAPDSIVCIDRNWNCTFANRVARLILQTDELVGANLWTAFPLNQEEPFASNYRATMEQGIPTEFEAYYPAPLNIWFKVFARPYEDGIIIFSSDITARKKAEARRDATTRQLQRVLEATTDAVASLARDWTFTFLNPRAQDLLSVKGDLIGRNLWEEFPAAQTGQFGQNLNRAMLDRVPTEFEDFYPEPLNLWLNIQCRPSDDGIVVFFRDVTSERSARLALLASEERYRVLADLNPQAIWMGAPDGRITYANQRFIDYVGTIDSHAGNETGWLLAFHEDDRDRVLESWMRSVHTGDEYETEARMVRAHDRASRWWWLRALPVRDDSGKILNWLGVAIDIHDRKTYADRLHAKQLETERQRAELESIYQTAPIGLALFDPREFRYLRVNDRQAETLGLPREQIIGRRVTELAPLEGLIELFHRVAAGEPIRNQLLEGELPTRPGEHRYWNVSYSPVRNPDGTVEAIAAVIQDITTQKKSEAALIQSEKLAAVGRLASSISHEINNPLEAITNILYLIDHDDSLPEELKPLVSLAQSELGRVCQIATQTLRFHRQAVRATHVTAQSLVGAVLNLYQGRLVNSGIHVEATYASSTRILCLENDIRQVLNNIIANAIDAMRQSGGQLLIRAHDTTLYPELTRREASTHRESGLRGPGPGDSHQARGVPAVRITIADTGHGMTPAVRPRIFEPFYTTKDLNGTGLGLWISAGIVARHNGRITLRSSTHPIHHGTIFSLLLPTEQEPTHLTQ